MGHVFVRSVVCLVILVLSPIYCFAEATQPNLEGPPAAALFANIPASSDYSLSPSGGMLGYFVSHKGRKHLVVQTLAGGEPGVIPPWSDDMEMIDFFWKSDEYVVFTVVFTSRRPAFGSKAVSESRKISMHIPSRKIVWLGKPNRHDKGVPSQKEQVVSRLDNDPEHILLALDMDLDGYPTVYKANLKKGSRRTVQREKVGVNQWLADQNNEVRLGFGYKVRGKEFNTFFKNSAGKWKKLEALDWFENFEVLGFGSSSDEVYIRKDNGIGTLGLFMANVQEGKFVKEIYSHKHVDVAGTIVDPFSGHLVGVSYVDDFSRQVFFNAAWVDLQRKLQRAFAGQVVTVISRAKTAPLILVKVESDIIAGEYYLFNSDKLTADWFASSRPQLGAEVSSPSQRVDIPVADGTMMPAYLTTPRGHSAENLPTVVLPHGGPWARDSMSWDFWAQFYASRGYLVLKPNFRGSTGYGAAYQYKGVNQWGGLMQRDVTDATKWLIEEGLSDPERICIVGASYGGYAALMGAIQEPGLYACAVSINGVTNLPSLKSGDRRSIGGRGWTKNMGLAGASDKSVSPYHLHKKINAPVLLMSSVNDARIPYKASKKLHRKLIKNDKDSTYVQIDTGSHHMLNAESRLVMLEATEAFLAKHLK